MQKLAQKKFTFFLFIIFFLNQNAYSQDFYQKINFADSLFAKQQYGKAYTIYDSLLSQKHLYTNQMLLKMAFVKEKNNEIPKALYLLNLYYEYNPSPFVERKITELAKRNEYSGYQFGEFEFIFMLYRKYFDYVLAAVLLFCVLPFSTIIKNKLRNEPLTYKPMVFIVLLCIVYYGINYTKIYRYAIVMNQHTYLMAAPSAASSVQEIIGDGHRLPIEAETDIWYEVKWNDKVAYVNKNNVEVLQ